MKALSIRQPWAWAILHAGKDIENRGWPTRYRGPLLVHAGMRWHDFGPEDMRREMGLPVPEALPRGGIVGVVTLVDCVSQHRSPWFEGPFGLVLAEPRAVELVPMRGQRVIFEVPDSVPLRFLEC